ncbi:large conductance mechanosensitive channel protein MscL [Amnibacterium sp. CER49]|uniref:large conductance mechanosensitive channel protein MscL n=1 Tax=Amnibacterium sp. CER49 TaxID=3039161 RepID=UPI0024487A1B|nr:large conductance mechanosensitive channel protein MscL [Amnibacterium sp. CER49]MDH2444180.1 large conductance mechanosensitive channel protein MscL [Amnibacterium sp. CER49]
MKGFRDFLLRGNVLDLAVAVVIGAAFTAIVTSVVTNVITPLIGALFNASSLDRTLIVAIPTLTHKPAELKFGAVLGAVINFVIVAAVVYFALVLPANWAMKRAFQRKQEEPTATPADTPPTEAELLIEIRDLLAGRPSPEGDHAQPPTRPAVPPT